MHKKIREDIHKAKKGNIAAQYRLFEVYDQGKWGAEPNEQSAKDYLLQCHNSINEAHLLLNSLSLLDFCKFQHLDIKFDKKLTVLVGMNGSGKTSILDAIAIVLSWLEANITKEDGKGKTLTQKEISIHSEHYAEVAATLDLGNHSTYQVTRAATIPGVEEKRDSVLQEIKALGDLFRTTNANHLSNLPLLIYYSVERSHESSYDSFSEKAIKRLSQSIRFDAYRHAFDKKVALNSFVEWFVMLDNWANGESKTQEVRDLSNEIKIIEQLLDEVDDRSISLRLEQKRHELAALSATGNFEIFSQQRKWVIEAVRCLLPDISDVFIDRSSGVTEVKVNLQGNKLNINQLSHGQKMLLGLAGDMARRLVTLNPLLKNPLLGRGIVLIDEIELHLHPKWQQTVIPNLQATFKNIQFIMTTHSPQVLSSIPSENIRLLTENIDDELIAVKPVAQSYARSNADVLETIMEVDSMPMFKEKNELGQYRQIVEQSDWKSLEAINLRKKLEKALGKDHSELIKLDSVIHRRELLG